MKIHFMMGCDGLWKTIRNTKGSPICHLFGARYTQNIEDVSFVKLSDQVDIWEFDLFSVLWLGIGGGGGKGRKDTVAGWSEFVKPYADESNFWGSVWSSKGSPRGGQTFEKMKHSKRQ